MSQPHESDDDREPAAAPAPSPQDDSTDDVEGHVYTGALQDKNEQP